MGLAAAAHGEAAGTVLTDAPRTAAPHRLLRGFGLWLGAVGLFGLLLFLYHYLAALAVREPRTPLAPFIEELTGAFVGGLVFLPLRRLVRRLPLTARGWPRRLPVYLLALLAFGAAATTLMWGLRSALFPLAGLGRYDYGVMPLRYLMELPLQVVWISVLVAALHGHQQGGRLLLEVEDDGPGLSAAEPRRPGSAPLGLGLSATTERLQLLYGDAQTFTAGNGRTGGFLVRAALPARHDEGPRPA